MMLQDKVAIVTGAGRGIGREIALEMARQGAAVVVNDLGASVTGEGADRHPGEETVGLITQAGGRAVLNGETVAEWDAAQRIVKTAIEAFGRLDIVVNNAGILRDVIFHKMTPEDWNAVLGVHLNGSFFVSRAAAPLFREQGSGAFVHMTSTSGLIGNFGQANYAAAKLGIVGLSKSIALDMARFGVRSNALAPFAWSRMIGAIPTDTPEQAARVAKLKAMTPDKIAPMAVFLASDRARDVTGQIFGVRNNEIIFFGQHRPVRTVQRNEGWTAETIAEHAIPALRPHFYKLDRSADVFSWDPV
ncbi:MAG: SDR family oxidoreductase [Acetobacteraceae bacterium]|nr:SDR family oxidoreductase [Acetobacteraceae bacterium]